MRRFDITSLTSFGTVSLGGLIKNLKERDQTHRVHFGFGYLVPHCLMSYRGFYDHLALGYGSRYDDGAWLTVASLVEALKKAKGDTFCGYKGGEYRMTLKTPVWVANSAEASSTAIVGISGEYETILQTEWVQV